MVDKIKSKANQRKPAMIYIDLSAAKCQEIIRTRGGYRKCYKTVSTSFMSLILYDKKLKLKFCRNLKSYIYLGCMATRK